MDKNWTARQRDDGYWYVEKGDGTAVLSAIGTPAGEREAVAKLAARAPLLEAALPVIWRAFDGLYGAKHKEPIPYDSLPKDRQKLFDAALDVLAELNEEDGND